MSPALSRFAPPLLLLAALAAGVLDAPVAAAAASQDTATGYYRTRLGEFEITALSDGTLDLPAEELLKQDKEITRSELAAAKLQSPVETSVNAYLINTGKRRVLVDTGTGALFGRKLGKLAANLRAAGVRPEEIDDILITHMHPDHIGGLSVAAATVFPNAVLHADKREADYWLNAKKLDSTPVGRQLNFKVVIDAVQPYVVAKHFQTFDGDTEIVPGIRSSATYGHTAGHTAYVVESDGQKLVIVGDLIHFGAVQWAHPEVNATFDADGAAALATRQRVFSQAAQDGAMIGAAHIAFPGLGHLRAAGTGFEWVPLN